MTNNEKSTLKKGLIIKYAFVFFFRGVKRISHSFILMIFFLLYILILCICWKYRLEIIQTPEMFKAMFSDLFSFTYILAVLVVTICGLTLLGMPKGFFIITKNMRRIGLVNSADETPVLISRYPDKKNSKIEVLEFESYGIPLSDWDDYQEKIGCALKLYVVSIEQGKNIRRILVQVVPSSRPWPELLEWRDEYLSNENFVLVCGEGVAGTIYINLAKVPHLLIGGSTGSGKSVLLKLLILQCVLKKATVYIADFKGGVDYSKQWNNACTMVFDEHNLLNILNHIVDELENRKVLLRDAECPNIDEYNRKTRMNLVRIIFACDEVAELSNFGPSKEAKELANKVESQLSVIARQGRAMGIHLILATQRPDAGVLTGQIKSNIDTRICGRATSILSTIVLDHADANDLIPKTAQGKFLMNDGTVFQAYWFDEDNLLFDSLKEEKTCFENIEIF